MIRGAETTRAGANGVVVACSAGVSCGTAAAGAGPGAAGTGVAGGRLTGPLIVLWLCCWWRTRVVKAASMATAVATTTSKNLFDGAQ